MKRMAVAIVGMALVAGCGSQAATSSTEPSTAPSGVATPAPARLSVSISHWTLPFAIAREAVVAVAPGKVIVAGGMLPSGSSSARAYALTLVDGQAVVLPTLPVDVHDVAGGLFAGEPATYGGGNSSEQSVVQVFHSGAWQVRAHLPTTRSDLSVATVNGTTYVLGGYDGSSVPTAVLAQPGRGALRPAGHLVVGVRYAATAVVGSSIYLFGGEVAGAELDVVQRYDTNTDKTTVVAHLPVPLGHASAALLGTRVLLMGGRVNPSQGTAAMWWFDPATHRFRRAGALPLPITDAAVALSPDGLTAWLLGGEDPLVCNGVIQLSLH